MNEDLIRRIDEWIAQCNRLLFGQLNLEEYNKLTGQEETS